MVRVMDAVFARMQSPDERELSSFVTTHLGGVDAVLKDDTLHKKLIEKQRSIGDRDAKGDTDSKRSRGRIGSLTVGDLRREIGQDVDQVVAQNQFFEQKFGSTLAHIDELKNSVENLKNTDRVIEAYGNGPHNQINDPVSAWPVPSSGASDVHLHFQVLRHIWKYHVGCFVGRDHDVGDALTGSQGWKGNVKATHLVTVALHDQPLSARSHTREGAKGQSRPTSADHQGGE